MPDDLAPQDEVQQVADEEAGDEKLVDLLENGEPGHAMTAPQGEIPIAFVQAVSRAVVQLDRAGQRDLADELLAACVRAGVQVSREPVPAVEAPEAVQAAQDPGAWARRWAALVARHVAAGQLDHAAAIMVAVGSRSKQFVPGDPDTEVNKQLHEMLDQLGYENLMLVTDKRRQALEREPHNLTLLWPSPTG